jgi:tetratricopeptide (TPR) repeat protein
VPALLGALFFALHPVQVEPVGWVSGFKDVLCWCLSLASLLVYVRRVQEAGGRPLWRGWEMPVSALLLALAILSKPTAMVVPAAMWLIDGLLLRRAWKRAAIPLIPLFALAAAGAALARQAQFVDHIRAAALWERPFIVGDTLAFYVRKILWPATLTIDYGRSPQVAMSSPLVFVWWIVPAALVAMALWHRHRRPIWLAATGLFLIGVAPVTGITTFQMQNYSTVTDHYLYFALLGPALALAWALSHWPSRALRGAAVVMVLALGIRTFLQTAVWYDSFTLFEHGIEANPRTYLSRSNLAVAYLRRSPPRPDIAERYVDEAYAISPDTFFVLDAYASTKAGVGKTAAAIQAWRDADQALARGPRTKYIRGDFAADVASNLLGMRQYDEALKWAMKAIEFEPNNPHAIAALVAARAATQPAKVAATTRAAATTSTSPARPSASMPSRAADPG